MNRAINRFTEWVLREKRGPAGACNEEAYGTARRKAFAWNGNQHKVQDEETKKLDNKYSVGL